MYVVSLTVVRCVFGLSAQAVRALSVAVAGAVLLFVAASWLFGYLVAQGVHAERDLEELMKQGDGLLGVSGALASPAAAARLAAA